MKKKLMILSMLCALSFMTAAQTFYITDSNFLKCLRNNYSTILKGDSIDITKASKVVDLNCNGQGISNVDGLQYFTGLVSLNLNFNSLNYLPDFSKMVKLENVNVTNNRLDYLPDLSHQKNLKIIIAHKNNLRSLPDLSRNTLLQRLDVNSNVLDTLPYLGHLKQLTYLNVVANNLKYIPGLESLTSLQSLIIWSNKIQALPPLGNLSDLRQLDASQNQLMAMPDVSASRKLELLFLDRNNLVSLSHFASLDSLKNTKLFSNRLTFKELLKITSKPNYLSYSIASQKTLAVGGKLELLENDSLVLTTGVDREVADVTYQWFKDGTFLSETSKDSLSINKVAFQNAGKYTCQLKHPAFPGFALYTDTFFVTVKPCLDVEGITTEVSGIRCMEPGSLIVQGLKPQGGNITYQLRSNTTQQSLTSKTGTFIDLKESSYSLSFSRGAKCVKTYPRSVVIPIEPCKEAYITPNNDGDTDSIFFHQVGKVTIYDKRGQIVKTLSIPSHWDGSSVAGALVAQGYYTAEINNGQETLNISVMY